MTLKAHMSLTALGLVAVLSLVSGCSPKTVEPKLTPKIAPPAIGRAGVLRAAIDLSYPPFGGVDKGVKAGLDIDVAAALAERLGLRLVVVEAKPEAGARLLNDGKVDVMLAGIPIQQAIEADVAFAGPYVNDGPCVFSLNQTTVTVEALAGSTVAVQKGSAAFWLLSEELGDEAVTPLPTLRSALASAASGATEFAAGDGLVGAYMLRDFPKLHFNGQIGPAAPLGVAVGRDSSELEAAVRRALDELSAQGVLETLRIKWIGDVPRLQGAAAKGGAGETTTPTTP